MYKISFFFFQICGVNFFSSSSSPSDWSSCSREYLALAFEHGMDYCLRNKPTRYHIFITLLKIFWRRIWFVKSCKFVVRKGIDKCCWSEGEENSNLGLIAPFED